MSIFTINKSYKQIEDDVLKPTEVFPSKLWLIAISISGFFATVFICTILYIIFNGMGTLGLNNPVGWAFDIINMIFWIGIGHAGTLISAMLFLFRQRWRTSISRGAEAMTIFAVAVAGMYPIIHTGRPWFILWTMPVPNERGSLWINDKSPLIWDPVAISTYLSVSALFWYMGLVPDFANMRDRLSKMTATGTIPTIILNIKKTLTRALALGWVGSARVWSHYEKMTLILSGISIPLVFSVSGIVACDFATSVIPGWHATIFPLYFVIGAVYSGFAMVLTLMIVTREGFKFKEYITVKHLENMAIIVLVTGSIVSFIYASEFIMAAYSGSEVEQYVFFKTRMSGPYAWAFWTMFTCNVVAPQLFWFKKIRTSIIPIFIISIVVNVGMWFERFIIIVTSLHQDFMPSSWDLFTPTIVDFGLLFGGLGLFFTFYLLFVRLLPSISYSEVKGDQANEKLAESHHHN